MPPHAVLLALVLTLAAASPAPRAAAQAPQGVAEGRAQVSLLPGWRRADGSRMAALVIELAPGWHTYWRMPGATGIPPQFDWSRSENLDFVQYIWPRPVVFSSYGARTIGYREEMVLPLVLVPETPGAPIALDLDLLFGVCDDICMPARARIALNLPADAAEAGRARIEAALSERARTPDEAGIAAVSCEIRPTQDGMAVTARIRFRAPPSPAAVVVESSDPEIWISEPAVQVDGPVMTAAAELDWLGRGEMLLDRGELRLTLLDAARAIDIRGCPAP